MADLTTRPTKKPMEQERVPFIERMRDEHIPLTLKSITSLEKVANESTFSNQKISEATEKLKQARSLTHEAQQALSPSDFLSKYREAHKQLTEGGIALAEGMEKNADDVRKYGMITAGLVLTTAIVIETRGLWLPVARAAITSSVTLASTQTEKLSQKVTDLEEAINDIGAKAGSSQAMDRYINALRGHLEISRRVASGGKIGQQDVLDVANSADRVSMTAEALAKEMSGETIYVKLANKLSQTLKYDIHELYVGAK